MTAVTLIALPGALGSTLTIPLEMLSAARDIARSRRHPAAELSLTIASDGHRSVELMGGMRLECESSLPDLTPAPASHIVFIPGLILWCRSIVQSQYAQLFWRQYVAPYSSLVFLCFF